MTFIVEPTRKAKFCGSLFLLFVLHECVEVSLTCYGMLCSICEVLYRSGQVVSSLSDTQSQQTRPANTLSSHGSSALSLSALIYYSLWMLYVSVGQYKRASIRSVCSRRGNVFWEYGLMISDVQMSFFSSHMWLVFYSMCSSAIFCDRLHKLLRLVLKVRQSIFFFITF